MAEQEVHTIVLYVPHTMVLVVGITLVSKEADLRGERTAQSPRRLVQLRAKHVGVEDPDSLAALLRRRVMMFQLRLQQEVISLMRRLQRYQAKI